GAKRIDEDIARIMAVACRRHVIGTKPFKIERGHRLIRLPGASQPACATGLADGRNGGQPYKRAGENNKPARVRTAFRHGGVALRSRLPLRRSIHGAMRTALRTLAATAAAKSTTALPEHYRPWPFKTRTRHLS